VVLSMAFLGLAKRPRLENRFYFGFIVESEIST
jgi:hypothetical protein